MGGVIATVHPLATEAGESAFRRGGNAVDAAVAAALTLGVVDGHNSGIGGGCFVLMRKADGTFLAIDGRETAPAAGGPTPFSARTARPTRRSPRPAPSPSASPARLQLMPWCCAKPDGYLWAIY